MVRFPRILIISNKFDFSTDLITYQLHEQGISYLRLNRDQLNEYQINFNPVTAELHVLIGKDEFEFNETTLESIYFRAPTFLREIFNDSFSEQEQLFITQWAAFIRALVVFENVKWINHPADTYKAEIKALQLKYAYQSGFKVPETTITNHTSRIEGKFLAIKSIDAAIVSKGEKEAFVYTDIIDGASLENYTYDSPFFIQQALTPKLDLRVTIIDRELIAIAIQGDGGIAVDWRKFDGKISYQVYDLPENIQQKCFEFCSKLNLKFAAIDLILHNADYYFIEVNPTGEWSWLQKHTGISFDKLIVKALVNENLG